MNFTEFKCENVSMCSCPQRETENFLVLRSRSILVREISQNPTLDVALGAIRVVRVLFYTLHHYGIRPRPKQTNPNSLKCTYCKLVMLREFSCFFFIKFSQSGVCYFYIHTDNFILLHVFMI
jgi:hypothetical protein